MDKTKLEAIYKIIKLRLETFTKDYFDKHYFIFSEFSYRYITQRLIEDGISAEFEQVSAWEYKLRKVEF